MAKDPPNNASDPKSEFENVDEADERPGSARTLTRSLDAAIEEAERDGYISAEEGHRQVNELLQRLSARAAAGQIKP